MGRRGVELVGIDRGSAESVVDTKAAIRRLVVGFALGAVGSVLSLVVAGMLPVRFGAPPPQPLGVNPGQPGSGVSVSFVTTATASVPAWVLSQGASGAQAIAFRAAVIDHPSGRILFGAGGGAPPGFGRVVNPFGPQQSVAFSVPDEVEAIVLPTLRWMHLGMLEAGAYQDVPIWTGPSDHWYAFRGPWPGRYGFERMRLMPLRDRLETVEWQRRTQLGFPKSYDYFGDGSVMLVALNGATKDEVAVSLVLESGRRLLLIGDAVWSSEAVEQRQRHAQWLGWTMDRNRTQLLATQARLHQLTRDYQMEVIPLLDGSLVLPSYPRTWD